VELIRSDDGSLQLWAECALRSARTRTPRTCLTRLDAAVIVRDGMQRAFTFLQGPSHCA